MFGVFVFLNGARGERSLQDLILRRNIIKIKIRASTLQLCEIEYFVETHLCKLCVILRLRVLLNCVCPH